MVEKTSKKEGQKPRSRKAAAKKGLTDRQKLFASEYLKDRNATQAAIRAGYSPKTAQEQSSRLLSNAMVRAFVDERAEKIAARIEVTTERIMAEYARIAFSDIRKTVKWGADMRAIHDEEGKIIGYTSGVGVINSDEIDDDTAAAISEVAETREGIRIKMHSKVDALHKLGLELGMFKQGVKIGGDAENPLIALVQSIQGSALPLGFQQPQAPAAPVAADPRSFIATSVAAPAPTTISPLLRPQED